MIGSWANLRVRTQGVGSKQIYIYHITILPYYHITILLYYYITRRAKSNSLKDQAEEVEKTSRFSLEVDEEALAVELAEERELVEQGVLAVPEASQRFRTAS